MNCDSGAGYTESSWSGDEWEEALICRCKICTKFVCCFLQNAKGKKKTGKM